MAREDFNPDVTDTVVAYHEMGGDTAAFWSAHPALAITVPPGPDRPHRLLTHLGGIEAEARRNRRSNTRPYRA